MSRASRTIHIARGIQPRGQRKDLAGRLAIIQALE
jgi:hypothetical protein